jgi:hypothetical protein
MKIDWKSFKIKKTREKGKKFPTGSRVYKGFQGSGKTLSMVKYAFDIKTEFPDCKIYSNIQLYGIPYVYIEKNADGDAVLRHALAERRGKDGVLVLLDEAHLYFHKKEGIPLDVLTAISQQRKDRRKLVFSSQIWEELDVSLRKQVKEVIDCKTLFGFLEINTLRDGETISYNKQQGCWEANKIRTEIYKLNDLYFHRYDTYQKIIKNSEYERPLGISEKTEYLQLPDKKSTKALRK